MKALVFGNFSAWLVHLRRDMRDAPGKWVSRLVYLLGPWACFVMVEILNENDLMEDFYAWQVLMNLIWYYILFFVCRVIFGRRKWAGTAAVALSFVAGLVNHYVLQFRGRILFPADIAAWRTAANVLGGFDLSPDIYIKQALIVLVAYLFLLWVCPRQKRRDKMSRPAGILLGLATAGYIYAFFFTGALPALGIYTQQWSTQVNGFLLNFTIALRYSVVEEPENYSEDIVLQIISDYEPTPADDSVTRPVNLIVIMNESFGDLTVFDTLETSEDPTPFLHSLEENTIKGWMYPPVTGGGTASTEFEYLTGFSNSFLPPHTVAYQLYVEERTPSLSEIAANCGYRTVAFHPYQSSGWNRPLVYSYLEFEEQLYQEDVVNPYYIRYYISDQSDYDTLRQITEEADGEPTFIFNVTMQNHSGYAQGWRNLERTITVSEELNEADRNANQFFSLMRASDEALENLIYYYERVDEPTMIVFFGDHQPALTNAFYEVLYGKKLGERTAEEILQQYAVPFFIWTNYDIEEQQDVAISSSFLGVLTAQTAGLPMTGWMNFLADLYEQIPVVNPAGYITADGTVAASADELTEEQQEWLWKYEVLSYSGLMDPTDEVQDFFHSLD